MTRSCFCDLHACSVLPFLSWGPRSSRALMEEIVDLARRLRADSGNFSEIGERRALDRLERPEVVQQRALARWADAGDFLQPGLPDIAPAPDAVRADCEAMRFVAQPLYEIEHRIARLELERLPPRHEEGLEPGIAIGPLGNRQERDVGDAQRGGRLTPRRELPPSAIDDDETRPG